MKKITTLFTVVAFATTLGLAGCKKDKAKEEPAPTPSPTEPAKTDPAKTDPAVTPTEPAKTDPAPAAGGTGMAECDEYMAAVEKYAACDKLPAAAKDATMKSVDAMKATWGATMNDDAKKAAATGCKAGIDALKTSAQALGCTI